MNDRQFLVHKRNGTRGPGLVKAWTRGVQVEDAAIEQLLNCASLPFIFRHVAAMPDCHWGMGSTVGSVIPTKDAVIPAAVGVDIGCGMLAHRTNLEVHDFYGPDLETPIVDLRGIRLALEAAVPHGRTENGDLRRDKGCWKALRNHVDHAWGLLRDDYDKIKRASPRIDRGPTWQHLGTLGSGNHFLELVHDEQGRVWIFIHSGSRGPGARIGNYYMREAKKLAQMFCADLPDPHLAFFPKGHPLFVEYMFAVQWAQRFAKANRLAMATQAIYALRDYFPNVKWDTSADAKIDCHHNYVAWEKHFGENILVTRKGATRAGLNEPGLIPGSMGTGSFIVSGRGCKQAFESCSHGAGRAMSRKAARAQFTVADHATATHGVECRKDEDVLDETPGAYKDISAVMAAQTELVDIVHKLTTFVCVKG